MKEDQVEVTQHLSYQQINELYNSIKLDICGQYAISSNELNEKVCRKIMEKHGDAILMAENAAFNDLCEIASSIDVNYRVKIAEWINIMRLIRGRFIVVI